MFIRISLKFILTDESIFQSDNGLAPNRRQGIISDNDDIVYWRTYASPIIDRSISFMLKYTVHMPSRQLEWKMYPFFNHCNDFWSFPSPWSRGTLFMQHETIETIWKALLMLKHFQTVDRYIPKPGYLQLHFIINDQYCIIESYNGGAFVMKKKKHFPFEKPDNIIFTSSLNVATFMYSLITLRICILLFIHHLLFYSSNSSLGGWENSKCSLHVKFGWENKILHDSFTESSQWSDDS